MVQNSDFRQACDVEIRTNPDCRNLHNATICAKTDEIQCVEIFMMSILEQKMSKIQFAETHEMQIFDRISTKIQVFDTHVMSKYEQKFPKSSLIKFL